MDIYSLKKFKRTPKSIEVGVSVIWAIASKQEALPNPLRRHVALFQLRVAECADWGNAECHIEHIASPSKVPLKMSTERSHYSQQHQSLTVSANAER